MAEGGVFEHCRALVALADRDRYLASLYAPAARRRALHALYAFNVELARVRDLAREPMPGEIRLQWWREVIEGKREAEAAAHPVAAALAAVMREHDLPLARLLALVDARAFDLYDEPMTRIAALEGVAEATDGAIYALAAQVLGGQSAACREAGLAHGYAGVLRALPRHAARGQIFLPREILDRFGVESADILAGKASFELRAALAEMRLRARRHLSVAQALLAATPAQILPALLPAALIRPTLARMEVSAYQPFKPQALSPWRRQWLIWRAARDPRRIFG